MRALHLHVERQLLDDAKLAFVRLDYAEAIRVLRRFVRTHPHSSLSPEARWWLARSYQGSGHLPAAARQFRRLANARRPHPYQAEALVRAVRLEEQLGTSMPDGPVNGILVSPDSFRMVEDPVSVIANHRAIKGEGAVVLLDIPCGRDGDGVRDAPRRPLRAMESVIRRLHDHGAAVYLGVTLRCLGEAAGRRVAASWRDRDYLPASGAWRWSSRYSLMFAGYRDFLIDRLSRLRDLPLAGLVFRSESPFGLYEGFSPPALHAFNRAFGVTFDPARVLRDAGPRAARDDTGVERSRPAVFWKWAGWKTREHLRILEDLVNVLRVRLPHLRFGLEVQGRGVVDPVYGLVHCAEDWAAMARGPFDVFLTTVADEAAGSTDFVNSMVRRLERPEQVWVVTPQASRTGHPSRRVPDGVGRVYDARVPP